MVSLSRLSSSYPVYLFSPCLSPFTFASSPICSGSITVDFVLIASLYHFNFSPSVLQTQNRVSRSLCTTCVLSAMPFESPRLSGRTAWLSALWTKTTLRSWSATAESCCGSSKLTPARPLQIPGTRKHTILQSSITVLQMTWSGKGEKFDNFVRLLKLTLSYIILWPTLWLRVGLSLMSPAFLWWSAPLQICIFSLKFASLVRRSEFPLLRVSKSV